MVLPAVLRDPAVDPRQADGRYRAVRLDYCAGVHPLARHVARALGALPPAVQAVLLALGGRLRRPRLARLETARRHLRDPVACIHGVLLRLLPELQAAARDLRKNRAAAEFVFGICPGCQGVSGGMSMSVLTR